MKIINCKGFINYIIKLKKCNKNGYRGEYKDLN